MRNKPVLVTAWCLSISVLLISFFVWKEANNGEISTNPYRLFPLLGVIAYGLMWVHYIIGAIRRYFDVSKESLKRYFEATSVLVLTAILLHPGLLIIKLWQDGQGLPPNSYIEYVAPTAQWAVALGSVSLLIFLSFELRHKFGGASWWHWLEKAQAAAMIAIFIHGLRLGGVLRIGWFRSVWYFYGVSFLVALLYSAYYDYQHKKGASQ